MLIDPTTEPTSHLRGTVFYVGVAPAKKSREGAKGLRSIDLTGIQMLPAYEKAARERIEALASQGMQPLVEAITAPWT